MQLSDSSVPRKYHEVLRYIDSYWDTLTFHNTRDHKIYIGLPNPYIAPTGSGGVFSSDQFYWDSYFIMLGLVVSGREEMAHGMIDNFAYLFKKYEIIPARNRFYNLGISQVPFLTSMIKAVYDTSIPNQKLMDLFRIADRELHEYWMDYVHEGDTIKAARHVAFEGLSRYCDHNITHATAEQESGWDMTSRFHEVCLDYVPVDLNSCLYKYETDLTDWYARIGDDVRAETFYRQAEQRKEKMMQYCWNEESGFFTDYNYKTFTANHLLSLAGAYPLWAGIATKEQAELVRARLVSDFEHDGGFVNTLHDKKEMTVHRQWDYPNGWAPNNYIALQGLRTYGFHEDADRITQKWLDMVADMYDKTGQLWEKYDVVHRDMAPEARYATQSGFGWTNGVFLRLIHDQYLTETPSPLFEPSNPV